MRIIVCGGRDYKNVSAVRHALTALHAKRPITLLIEGGATGADRLAREWAISASVPFETVEANWHRHGKAAGPIRNGEMLKMKPDGLLALPGGRGTADMIEQAERASVKVWRPFG